MRRPLITDSSPWPVKAATIVLLLPLLIGFIVLKLVMKRFEKPASRAPEEVVRYLRDFFENTGGDRDWDDFISIPIADPQLDNLRERAAALDLPMADADTGPLQALIAEAEALVSK